MTERQWEVLAEVLRCVDADEPVTVRSLGKTFGIASMNGVVCHLNPLVKRGYLRREGVGSHIRLRPGPNVVRTRWGWVPLDSGDLLGCGPVDNSRHERLVAQAARMRAAKAAMAARRARA